MNTIEVNRVSVAAELERLLAAVRQSRNTKAGGKVALVYSHVLEAFQNIGAVTDEDAIAWADKGRNALQMTYLAWREFSDGRAAYVESIQAPGARGAPYSYTTNADRARRLTAAECNKFLAYMNRCGSKGKFVTAAE